MAVRQNTATITGPAQIEVNGQYFGTLVQGLTANETIWSLQTHGDLPTKSWRLYNTSGAGTVVVVEFILPTSIIAAGLDEFRRAYSGSGV